jgi:hypothetical protein
MMRNTSHLIITPIERTMGVSYLIQILPKSVKTHLHKLKNVPY